MPHKYLLKEFEDFAGSAPNPESLMQRVAQRIHAHIPRYNWVGFYLVNKKDPSTLVLGPYTGSFTPKATLSVTQGLCGWAASTGRVIVADNVAEEPRYIHASDLVKSQIVVPIMAGSKTLAVLNVESYFMSSFRAAQERDFVEACARIVGKCLARTIAFDLVNA
ncbi:MAG TPA: GAF domain-containing protein [Candidatus Angelobacter sp.]|jgi:GAF domain-containing protein